MGVRASRAYGLVSVPMTHSYLVPFLLGCVRGLDMRSYIPPVGDFMLRRLCVRALVSVPMTHSYLVPFLLGCVLGVPFLLLSGYMLPTSGSRHPSSALPTRGATPPEVGTHPACRHPLKGARESGIRFFVAYGLPVLLLSGCLLPTSGSRHPSRTLPTRGATPPEVGTHPACRHPLKGARESGLKAICRLRAPVLL